MSRFLFDTQHVTCFVKLSQYLPVRAYTYAVPNVSQMIAEYTYRYVTTGDYVTQMTIERQLYGETGEVVESKEYVYTFEYNYVKP